MQIRPTDTTVGDLDINIGLLPLLGLELLPDHVAIGGSAIKAKPAFELVVGVGHIRKCDGLLSVDRWDNESLIPKGSPCLLLYLSRFQKIPLE